MPTPTEMIALVRKNLGCCKSHASLSLLIRNFSTPAWRDVVDVVAVRDVLVKKHHFAPESASVVASHLGRLRSPERADSILSFLQENRFSSIQLQRIVRTNPRILTASVEDDVKLKIKIFKDFGFAPEDIAKIITGNVAILHSSAEKKIVPQLSTLEDLIGSNVEVVELVKKSGWYMTVDLEKTLVPNLQLLKAAGVDKVGMRLLLYNYPRCLLVKPETMRTSVEKVNEIGVDPRSKAFVYAVRAVASLKEETWELKLQGFKDMGVSESQVLQIFRAVPSVLCSSMEKIKAIRKLLVATGRFDLSDMVKDPSTFLCSIEKRYKPRIQVLEILESKKVIEKWPSLRTICRMPHDKFFEKFVRPYSEYLGEVCVTNGCVEMAKGRKQK